MTITNESIPIWSLVLTFVALVSPLVYSLIKMFFMINAHEKLFEALDAKINSQELTMEKHRLSREEQFAKISDDLQQTKQTLTKIETLLNLLIENKIR